MTMHRPVGLDDYYAEAASWNADRVAAIHSSKRIAWWVAVAAAAIALFEAVALALLTPLKTVEPYTLLVDRTTGYVEALKPLEQPAIAPDSALTRSFLVQYVIAREGFDRATLNANYRKVALFSAGPARSAYLASMQASSPQSPLALYPSGTTLDVRVKSVSPIGAHTALVRFETVRTSADGRPQPASAWVAVVKFAYSRAPMSEADRFINPLGFQVTGYRKDAEALTDPAPADSAAAPAAEAAYYPSSAAARPPRAVQ